jgi:hypothetical protein
VSDWIWFFYSIKIYISSWAWWYRPIVPTIRRLRHEDQEYEASLGYIVNICLKTTTKNYVLLICTWKFKDKILGRWKRNEAEVWIQKLALPFALCASSSSHLQSEDGNTTFGKDLSNCSPNSFHLLSGNGVGLHFPASLVVWDGQMTEFWSKE